MLDKAKELLPVLLTKYGLSSWDIFIKISEVDSPDVADVDMSASNYKQAVITIYSKNIDNDDELHKALEHEVLHILLAPFQQFYAIARQGLNGSALAILDATYTHFDEKMVRILEDLLVIQVA